MTLLEENIRPPTEQLDQQPIPAGVRPPTKPWSHEIRVYADALYANRGQAWYETDPDTVAAVARKELPPSRTIRTWRTNRNQQPNRHGTLQAYRHTGNKRSEVLVGDDLILLALYVRKWPGATAYNKSVFLWDAWGRFQVRRAPYLFSLWL